jgi:hypothetical protein
LLWTFSLWPKTGHFRFGMTSRAEKAVAAPDAMIKEGQRFARLHGFQPEVDLAELRRQGV